MASISYSAPARGALSLESGVAAFAAAATAFAVYAMPADLFADIVAASGLAGFLAAAQPPLGLTARLAAVAVAAIVTFGAVWALLRALDRVSFKGRAKPVVVEAEAEDEAAVPRLRRFDAHPDAPARRPIFAARDLGEPEMEAEAEEAVEAEPLLLDQPAPEAEAEPEPESVALDAPQPFELEKIDPAAFDPPAAPVEPEEPAERDESISNLMQRLEGGLSRRELGGEGGQPAAVPPPSPQAATSHRLRSALTDLQKMAGRG